jgi:YesN/AraC family two-component response regulator
MIRIVFVDDHQLFLDGIGSVFAQQKEMEVLAMVNKPSEALTVLKNTTPNLLITDISMPEINGLEFIKIVKKNIPA